MARWPANRSGLSSLISRFAGRIRPLRRKKWARILADARLNPTFLTPPKKSCLNEIAILVKTTPMSELSTRDDSRVPQNRQCSMMPACDAGALSSAPSELARTQWRSYLRTLTAVVPRQR